MPERLRIADNGSIKLPEKLREQLGWCTGNYIEFEVSEGRLTLWRVEVDLFAEAAKAPDDDAFDKALKRQKESRSAAFDEFERKMKDPPKLRPEDRPQFWD